jgi:hypothetical protein
MYLIFFLLNLEVIQLKLMKDLAQISDYLLGPMLISEEEKTNSRKLSLVFC